MPIGAFVAPSDRVWTRVDGGARRVQEMVWTRVDGVDGSRHASVGWIRSYPAADGWRRQVFEGAVAGSGTDDGWRRSHTIISVPPMIPNGAMK